MSQDETWIPWRVPRVPSIKSLSWWKPLKSSVFLIGVLKTYGFCEQLGVPKFPSNLASALNYKHHKLTQVGQFSTKKLPAIWVCLKMNNLLQNSTKLILMFPMGECSFMGSPESTSFSDKHNISYSSLYIRLNPSKYHRYIPLFCCVPYGSQTCQWKILHL